jgi:hypothetical protein
MPLCGVTEDDTTYAIRFGPPLYRQNGFISHEDLQGQKTLALFLQELIQKQDPALATMLHAPKNSKPFTTAILKTLEPNGLGRPEDKEPVHRSKASHGDQGEMKMRLTLLDDALYPLISQFSCNTSKDSNPAPWSLCFGHLKGLRHLRKWGAVGWIRRLRDDTGPRLGNRDIVARVLCYPHSVQIRRCRPALADSAPVLSELAQQLG